MAVPPSVLWGRSRRSVTRDGVTIHDPEWLASDLAWLAALDNYEATLCACGEPWESHKGKTKADYASAYLTCPALEAEEAERVKRAKADGHAEAKVDPSRPRIWITKTLTAMQTWAEAMRGGDGDG